jgi:hypothetical protein
MTICELAKATGRPLPWLRAVLGDELHAGRIVRDDAGSYRLVRSAFPPRLLAALVALELEAR